MPAIFGTLHVAMVFLLGTRLHGRRFGLILSLMVALWPEHIFHSQQNRFYMFAMCGSTLAFFLATFGLQESSKKHLIGALVVAALSVTTHTLATGLAPMFYFAILASLVVCRAKVSRRFTVNGLSVVRAGCFLCAVLRVAEYSRKLDGRRQRVDVLTDPCLNDDSRFVGLGRHRSQSDGSTPARGQPPATAHLCVPMHSSRSPVRAIGTVRRKLPSRIPDDRDFSRSVFGGVVRTFRCSAA